ncbi:MAG: sulfatase [Planctomycetota bacterium]
MFLLCSLVLAFLPVARAQSADQRPNILWITIEDWGPDLSCYGTPGIATPNVDKLAAQGIRYQWAFTTSPVCSTSRSAMMTGFHQNYIHAHQHREYNKKPLPNGIRPLPHLLKDAGYFTALMSRKVDCNFLPDKRSELFEGTDWKQRESGQPFFARITLQGTHRSWQRDPIRPIETGDVRLPPYYADTEFIRRDWANGLEQMQIVDRQVGALLTRLKEEGLANNTVVFFIGDHGRCHIRGKQFLYDGGIRIPMIVRWPNHLPAGHVNTDLVTSLDLCATVLQLAGAKSAVPLHGDSLFAADTLPTTYECTPAIRDREYIFAARDRMGDTHDSMRCIRSKSHKLILNLMPQRAYCQYSGYKEGSYPALAEMNVLHQSGKLTAAQSHFFAAEKPEIELYDLRQDPHELHNIADQKQHAAVRDQLLQRLNQWRRDIIMDRDPDPDFQASGVFPTACPLPSVEDWVLQNPNAYDYQPG